MKKLHFFKILRKKLHKKLQFFAISLRKCCADNSTHIPCGCGVFAMRLTSGLADPPPEKKIVPCVPHR